MECKSLRESGDDIRKFDVAYFAASVDPLDTITKFAKSLDADYPMLADVDATAAKAYGVVSPDRQYPQRWTFYIGSDGKILYVDKSVKPQSAGADVAKRLAELKAPAKKTS
jgi:thioredoxin-dependent peroxiredoxin